MSYDAASEIPAETFVSRPVAASEGMCLSPQDEARVFWRMRYRLMRTVAAADFFPGTPAADARLGAQSVVVVGIVLAVRRRIPVSGDGHRPSRDARPDGPRGFRHVLRRADGDAGVFIGRDSLRVALPIARGRVPADDSGAHRAGLPAQVPGGRPAEQLGIRALGKPHAAGLRHRGRGAVVLLRPAAADHAGLHLHPVGHRRHPLPGRHAPAFPPPRPSAEPGRLAAGGRRQLDRLVAVDRARDRHAHARLVPGAARPAAVQRATPAAELVAQFGTARGGAGRLVGKRAVRGPADRPTPCSSANWPS